MFLADRRLAVDGQSNAGNGPLQTSGVAVNRFSRLVDLRSIREESAAMAYSQKLAELERLKSGVEALDAETREAKEMACRAIDSPVKLPPRLYDDFIQGQKWRRQRMLVAIDQKKRELETAKKRWHAARVELRQAEKLAEKESVRRARERKDLERKELDMVGVLQRQSHFQQEEIH